MRQLNSRIALCIPAYNAEKYLPRLLESANSQTILFDEILVYNDCSTDMTEEVAMQYGAKVINGDINKGCSYGKNKLTEITNCKWIHFHDADDELYPNFVETAQKWIKKPDCPDVILFSYEYRDHETGNLLSTRHYDSNKLRED
ncbi:MAG: glycosyltransferase family 2 protein, partial [Thermodesulfobacteriota bacterium]